MPAYTYRGTVKNEPTIIPPGGRIKPCGTRAGYRRHQRHNEYPCRECKIAYAKYEAERRGYTYSGVVMGDPTCGTNRGYLAHLREHTRPCLPCYDAHAEAARNYYNQKKATA